MKTNRKGDPVRETTLGPWNVDDFTKDEIGVALVLIAQELGYDIVRTNLTKHGTEEIELRVADQ